ncbi:MAG TPA: ribonuclease III [Thermodesulfovibrionales bacterium]|nr:ribonuclease III [Thermodesulfovibrionales bacterium]
MRASYSRNTESLEDSLGYVFKKSALLAEALTHKSYHHENPRKAPVYNERLEFLGDSVLALVIVEYIFSDSRMFSESLMAKIKSYLVTGSLLSEVAGEIDLGHYLRLGKGEEDTGGRRKKSILADAMEAVFGAVYLDGGYEEARRVILRLFRERMLAVIESGQCHDYKTELQEKSQTLFGVLPEYRLIGQEGDEHRKTFTVEVLIGGRLFGCGEGKSKKEAQMTAAREAIGNLDRDGGLERSSSWGKESR